jgi:diacylglycerol kinase (ATP)
LKYLFIINPASARGNTLRDWPAVRSRLASLGVDFDEHVTARPGEASEVARQALIGGTTRLIAVGGDGTLNEVVNGYFDEQGCPINRAGAIGLLPSGTGSDFRRSLASIDHRHSIEALIAAEPRLIDAARADFRDDVGGEAARVFINIASFGLGGQVSALVNRWRSSLPRWIGGRARFAAAAVAGLGRYANVPVEMELDGRQIQISSNLIVVANGKFAGGGMLLAPHAQLDDGVLDVIVTDKATRLDVIRELPRIQRGGYLRNPKVTQYRAGVVSIDSDKPLAIDLDGEMVGYTPARVRVLPSTVRLLFL